MESKVLYYTNNKSYFPIIITRKYTYAIRAYNMRI